MKVHLHVLFLDAPLTCSTQLLVNPCRG
jgi:hypothetical protein